jgi:hypothetical protein
MSDINVSSLAQAGSSLTALSSLILVTPLKQVGIQNQNGALPVPPIPDTSVKNQPGLPKLSLSPNSILFQYEGENTVSLESDVTEHYSEKNSVLSDNITLKPESITVHGFVGELTDESPIYPEIVNLLRQKLYTLSAYTPDFSVTALNLINEAIYAYTIANSLVSSAQQTLDALGLTNSTINGVEVSIQNRQQKYFLQFYNFWLNRTLFTVQTPWAIFNNMVIRSFRAIQSPDTRVITDFEITFKRYYSFDNPTQSTALSALNSDGRNAQMVASNVSQGVQQLNPSATTFNPGSFA